MRLWTIGYAGRRLDEFIATLAEAGVEQAIDVRAVPMSRQPGFSKRVLQAALEAVDIQYVHLQAAGNPFRKQADALLEYFAYLEEHPEVIEELTELATLHPSALLCLERDPLHCHRTILAQALRRSRPRTQIIDL